MQANTIEQIEALKTSETKVLVAKWQEAFGNAEPPSNRFFLIRRLTYKLQETAHGGLSPALKNTIIEMIQTYDPINKRTFKTRSGNLSTTNGRDPRLPMPGSLLTKLYKGNRIEVRVLESGFEHNGTTYRNLSAVAKAVTGAHWNGFGFFGLEKDGKN